MRVYVDFFYENKTVGEIYKNNPYSLCVNYDRITKSKTGAIFLIDNKKVNFDRMGIKFITIDLDDEFLDYYLRNQNNIELQYLDLRACWFLNKLEPDDDKYHIKWVRDCKFIFSKTRICEYYNYMEFDRNVMIACDNDAFAKGTDNKFYCLQHVAIK